MESRRKFIRELSGGLTATLAASSTTRAAHPPQTAKTIRIGIIGAENSHTVGYGQLFNRDRKFPGCEVIGVWGETPEFAKAAAEKGHIPLIVKELRLTLHPPIDFDHLRNARAVVTVHKLGDYLFN